MSLFDHVKNIKPSLSKLQTNHQATTRLKGVSFITNSLSPSTETHLFGRRAERSPSISDFDSYYLSLVLV